MEGVGRVLPHGRRQRPGVRRLGGIPLGGVGDIQVTEPLRELAEWLVSLDEPDVQPRRSVSLSMIVQRAKTALQLSEKISTTPQDSTQEIPRALCTPEEDSAVDLVHLSSGQRLRAHPAFMCEGKVCCIHNPSAHSMSSWAQYWREDRGLMERTCSHGVGHPDPDDIAFRLEHEGLEMAYIDAIHGCDGCCRGTNYFPHAPEQEGDKADE